MNTASLLWGWYPRLYPRLRLQWILLLFFEGDIPNYKASHFFNSGKEVWRWWCGSGFLAQEWAERFSSRLTFKLSCMHVCVMLWEEARTMMIITLLPTWVAWRAQWALMMLTSAASKKKIWDQMRISSVPSETGKSNPRIFLVMEKDILHDKKNILQYEETETESRPHHPLFWKEDTG